MLKRCVHTRDRLLVVADRDSASITIDRSSEFEIKVKEFSLMLSEIDAVIKELQKRITSLLHCRCAVNLLNYSVNEGKNDPSSPFYGCMLSNKYWTPRANIVINPEFESGVVKIQNGAVAELTQA